MDPDLQERRDNGDGRGFVDAVKLVRYEKQQHGKEIGQELHRSGLLWV
jgi:hypothetical protein